MEFTFQKTDNTQINKQIYSSMSDGDKYYKKKKLDEAKGNL